MRLPIVLSLVLAVAAATLAQAGAGAKPKLAVHSSLDGITTIPRRIHWTASPTVQAGQIERVVFSVDGRTVWIEHRAPYYYGQDGNWLVTTWLKPGTHHFAVEAVTTSGQQAVDEVRARTTPTPPPPTELVGRWQRTIRPGETPKQTPPGLWKLGIDSVGWQIKAPKEPGHSLIDVVYLPGNRVQLRTGIYTTPDDRFGGNGFCLESSPPVTYHWSVADGNLSLTLVGPDHCGGPGAEQHLVVASAWQKAP
jgi:hypothetical protein